MLLIHTRTESRLETKHVQYIVPTSWAWFNMSMTTIFSVKKVKACSIASLWLKKWGGM